jgi:choline kinase
MARVEAVILAAGLGTRLGRPFPKPLTPLPTGETIIGRQVALLREAFGEDLRVTIVVGFKLNLVIENNPDVAYVYNEIFDATNTSKSLLKALQRTGKAGVLWLNGDVVFDPRALKPVRKAVEKGQSFVAVNTASTAEEEVKYTVDKHGYIDELSKQVRNALGEALGINYVSREDKAALIRWLEACGDQDYFERGIELAIANEGVRFRPLDISRYPCVEVDFEADLDRANAFVAGQHSSVNAG